jgi:hypothetical protein
MPKRRHYIVQKHRQQLFDSSMKGLTEQAPKLIECLLPGAIYQDTLTVEIIRPPLRADQVHRGLYRGEPHIFHVEYQVKHDPQLQARLLTYCSDLSKVWIAGHLPGHLSFPNDHPQATAACDERRESDHDTGLPHLAII